MDNSPSDKLVATVKDTDPPAGLNPDDVEADKTVHTQPDKTTPDGPFDDKFPVVSGATAGPNKVVATGSDGKLPSSIIPASAGGVTTQTVTAKVIGTTYQNTLARALFVSITLDASGSSGAVYCDSAATPVTAVAGYSSSNTAPDQSFVFFIVPPGYYYKLVGGNSISVWVEYS